MPYALKTINLDRYPPEAWRVLLGDFDGGAGDFGATQAYDNVGIVFRAIDIRAGAVSHLPWVVERRGRVVDAPELMTQLVAMMYMLETLYICYGAVYCLKDGPMPLGLRYVLPPTMKPETSDSRGLVAFERTIGQRKVTLPKERVLWSWAPSISVEIGPGPAPLARALPDAAIRAHLDAYLAAFFERGALRPTLWLFDGNPTPQELERVEGWTQKVVSGVKNAFRHIGLRKVAQVQQIGDTLAQTYDVELSRSTIENALTTLGVPASLVLANAANYATAGQDALNFMLRTVLPQAERYIVMLAPYLQQMGYALSVNEAQIEELQQLELQKASALVQLTGGPVMTQSEARERLELPPIAPDQDELARLALLKQIEIVKAATDATIPLEAALQLAGLEVELPEPKPDPMLMDDMSMDEDLPEEGTEEDDLDAVDWDAAIAEVKKLTPEQRSEIARIAAQAQWEGHSKQPRKPKGRKPKKDKLAESANNRAAVFDQLQVAEGRDVLAALEKGEMPDEAEAEKMREIGLVERADDGTFRMSAAGRMLLNAASRGDTGRAGEIISRAKDAATRRKEREQKKRGKQRKEEDAAKWLAKSLKRLREGKGAAVPFVSDAIDADDAAWIADELSVLDNEHDVKHLFAWVKKEPGTGLTPREKALYDRVLAVLTRYRGEIAGAIVNGDTLDFGALTPALRGALQADLVAAALDVMSDYAESIGPDFDPADAAGMLQTWSAEYTQNVAGKMSETTRTMVEKTVSAWRATPGATRQQLIDMLAPAFGARRAETIAITSATEAAAQAALQYQKYLEANGLMYIRVWRTVNDEGVCAICDPLNGKPEDEWIDTFPQGPPAHARCRCAVSLTRDARPAKVAPLNEKGVSSVAMPVHRFANGAEGDAFMRANARRITLTDDERAALEFYQGAGYEVINGKLRGTLAFSLDAQEQQIVDARIAYLRNITDRGRTTENIESYRGMFVTRGDAGWTALEAMQPGKTFREPGFMSTSVDAQQIRQYSGAHAAARNSADEKSVTIRVRVPEGIPAAYMNTLLPNGNVDERELLLGDNLAYRIIGRRESPGLVEVDMEIVP